MKGIRGAVAVLAAGALLAGAPSAKAGMTGLEKWSTTVAYNELGAVESPWGSNKIPGKPYGNLGMAWCAHFVDWVLGSSGIQDPDGGRIDFNENVARAWGKYGPAGGGYGRWGSARDAMPGDLLVDKYDGTATTGGHISMVVMLDSDSRYVWTVGGNENNGVRLQRKDVTANSRYLVTLWEYRSPKSSMVDWNGNTVGTVNMTRHNSIYGPVVRVTSLTDSGKYHSGSSLASTYTIRALNKSTGKWEWFKGDAAISSIVYSKAEIYHSSGWGNYATILYEDTYVDKSKAGTYTSTS